MITIFLGLCTLRLVLGFPNSPNFVHPGEESVRIIGGKDAKDGDFPYQVALEVHGIFSSGLCSGSLISKNYILTSANCIISGITADVIFGTTNLHDESQPNRKVLTSNDLNPHEDYDSQYLINDIGLVKLPHPIDEIPGFIEIISLSKNSDSYANLKGKVAGWGTTNDDDQTPSETLKYIESTIMSNEDCAKIDPFGQILQKSHLCLDGKGNVGACNGDNGSPLVVNGEQIGIYSFNYRECTIGKPSVFTRISEFMNWIKENSDL